MRPSRAATLLLIALAFLQAAYYGPRLPDPVASHFNAAGQPNDWMSRSGFLLFNLLTLVGMAAVFLALPSLIGKLSNEWINLPNKDYWLAPERRAATLDTMARWMEWMGTATIAFLLAIVQLTIQANLSDAQQLDNTTWILTGVYLVGLMIWTVGFLRWSLKKPPQVDQSL